MLGPAQRDPLSGEALNSNMQFMSCQMQFVHGLPFPALVR